MGAAGRAIGPDGKLIKQEQKNGVKKGGVQQRNQGQGKGQRSSVPQRFPEPKMRPFEHGGPHGGPPGHGPRPLMAGPGMGGPMRGYEGPMGPRPGMGGPGGPGGSLPMQAMRLFQGSAPDPTGSYGGFFGPRMNDGGSGSAPPASTHPPRKEINPPAPMPMKPAAPVSLINPTAKSNEAPGTQGHVGEVPGFGNNSSIHELFGKMVWRKMESLRDQQVIDELQNKIMNLIHDALAAQNAPPPAAQGLNRGAFMQGPRHF